MDSSRWYSARLYALSPCVPLRTCFTWHLSWIVLCHYSNCSFLPYTEIHSSIHTCKASTTFHMMSLLLAPGVQRRAQNGFCSSIQYMRTFYYYIDLTNVSLVSNCTICVNHLFLSQLFKYVLPHLYDATGTRRESSAVFPATIHKTYSIRTITRKSYDWRHSHGRKSIPFRHDRRVRFGVKSIPFLSRGPNVSPLRRQLICGAHAERYAAYETYFSTGHIFY